MPIEEGGENARSASYESLCGCRTLPRFMVDRAIRWWQDGDGEVDGSGVLCANLAAPKAGQGNSDFLRLYVLA